MFGARKTEGEGQDIGQAGNKIHLSSTFPFFLRATGSLTATPRKPSRYLPSNELQDFFSGCE